MLKCKAMKPYSAELTIKGVQQPDEKNPNIFDINLIIHNHIKAGIILRSKRNSSVS